MSFTDNIHVTLRSDTRICCITLTTILRALEYPRQRDLTSGVLLRLLDTHGTIIRPSSSVGRPASLPSHSRPDPDVPS